MAEPKFRPDIQGLRAIAVLTVVAFHAGLAFLPGGYVGVDIFYVISGYLITTHLLDRLRSDGTVKFASFYARRARRILPAAFTVLAMSLVIGIVVVPPLQLTNTLRDAIFTAFYLPNVGFALSGTNYLAETTPSVFQHYWSLGVEEQFYLAWPLAVWTTFRLWRGSTAAVAWVLGILAAISLAGSIVITPQYQAYAFFLLPTRAWELAAGALAALALHQRDRFFSSRIAAETVGWAGLTAIALSVILFDADTAYPGYAALLPVTGATALVVAGLGHPQVSYSRVLSLRPVQWIGRVSYSLYLVHWPLLTLAQAAVGYNHPLTLPATLVLGALSFPIAALLYHYVETPGRKSQRLSRSSPRRILLGALTASVIVAIFAAGVALVEAWRPLKANRAVATSSSLQPNPQPVDFVPNNLTPSLRDAASDNPILYEDGCQRSFTATDASGCRFGATSGPRVVLFGDSHAAQWFPALDRLATEHGWVLETDTKSSCPSISATIYRNGSPYGTCRLWRDGVIKRLKKDPPALVILSNYGVAPLKVPDAAYASAWRTALQSTINRLQSSATKVAVLADTPDMKVTPAICLSAHINSADTCVVPRTIALSNVSRAADLEAARATGASYLDLTEYVCGQEGCPPIIDGTLVYRDAQHMTATFASRLAQPLLPLLMPLLSH